MNSRKPFFSYFQTSVAFLVIVTVVACFNSQLPAANDSSWIFYASGCQSYQLTTSVAAPNLKFF